jgi:hypothetical protein
VIRSLLTRAAGLLSRCGMAAWVRGICSWYVLDRKTA